MLKKLTNILLTFAMFLILNVANANEFPSKTITIVCNWSAGGGQDTVSTVWDKPSHPFHLRYKCGPFCAALIQMKGSGGGPRGHQSLAHQYIK